MLIISFINLCVWNNNFYGELNFINVTKNYIGLGKDEHVGRLLSVVTGDGY